jgi:hypothetical protein
MHRSTGKKKKFSVVKPLTIVPMVPNPPSDPVRILSPQELQAAIKMWTQANQALPTQIFTVTPH